MEYLKLQNTEIPYKITKKRNKNTYFYFKREGFIQINLSVYQTKKDALDYIIKNQSKFIKKLEKSRTIPKVNKNDFLLLGNVYNINIYEQNLVKLDTVNNQVYLPTTDINHSSIKQFYKNEMLKVITDLNNKYLNNKYVNLDNVIYNTRYTNTRHGSCNAKKRRINLNLHLIKYDMKFIEYVYLHEITHLVHQNHGIKFYDLLEKLCPNYKSIRREMKEIYR